MSRLIDADALKSALAHAAKNYCNRNGPLRTIDFESLIDKAPTIDAIPVEWLKHRLTMALKNGSDAPEQAIRYVLWLWGQQKDGEQEAR